jgi:hypothetical protein
MSSAATTLNEVSLLVAALPGVSVLERYIDGSSAVFKIATLGVTSAHLIERMCLAANVQLDSCLPIKDSRISVDTPRHMLLTASTEQFDLIHFGYLQLLGVHLVWHLHHIGAMPTDSVNRFLQRWNAVGVGA